MPCYLIMHVNTHSKMRNKGGRWVKSHFPGELSFNHFTHKKTNKTLAESFYRCDIWSVSSLFSNSVSSVQNSSALILVCILNVNVRRYLDKGLIPLSKRLKELWDIILLQKSRNMGEERDMWIEVSKRCSHCKSSKHTFWTAHSHQRFWSVSASWECDFSPVKQHTVNLLVYIGYPGEALSHVSKIYCYESKVKYWDNYAPQLLESKFIQILCMAFRCNGIVTLSGITNRKCTLQAFFSKNVINFETCTFIFASKFWLS